MIEWDGNINSPHTMQDEYELAQRLGVSTLTTDDDGQVIAATDDEWCARCQSYGNVHDPERHGLTMTAAIDLDTCPSCDGEGAIWDDQTGQPDEPNGGRMVTCPVCDGERMVDTSPCIACGAPNYDHDEGCPASQGSDR